MLLSRGREQIKTMHREGRPPREVAAALTDLCDRTVERVYHQALASAPAADRAEIVKHLSLVALGGYGRRDLAPYSDLDLLLLTTTSDRPALRSFTSHMVRDLWDVGLELSHSVRTVADCAASARQDLTICTALAEARLLIGGTAEFAGLQRQVHRLFSSMPINRFIGQIESERAREHHDYHAQTVLLLEPNVKKSPGGLRDYHVLRWVALARHGVHEPDRLRAAGILTETDADALEQACAFLQKIRIEMHCHAGEAQDVLTREEQLRLAAWLNVGEEGQLLGVERFMQQYYRQTTALHDVVTRFLDSARRPGWIQRTVERVSTRRVERDFLLNRRRIAIAPAAVQGVLADSDRVLHLFDLARGYGTAVEYATLENVRAIAADVPVTPDARQRFLRMLANPSSLGWLLRQLDRVGLLARMLPPFAHAHCLIQFNLYHKYTVDEHSIRAVEAAARRGAEQTPLGQAYREIHRKDLLHLALLLHDLGKGLSDDHCETGRQIAEQVARDFELNEHDRRVLCFLVHQHLLMAITAFRRDLQDEATLVQFARAVATPEMLRMLYVMTAADTEAVSAENWTAWKESLLNELYFRTAEELTGESPVVDEHTRRRAICSELTGELAGAFPDAWLADQLALMPLSYLQATPTLKIRRHLEILRGMAGRPVQIDSAYLSPTGMIEFTVFTRDDVVAGLFSRIAGTLAAAGFQIVSARIVTRADGTVIDTFCGQDLTFTGEPPPERRAEVAEQIAAVLLGRSDVEQLLARRRSPFGMQATGLPRVPPQIEIDNDSSARCTIVEVFAEDRLGLLYAITRTFVELGLSVASARISTHVDQVVDVFYVTTLAGEKLRDDAQAALRVRLGEKLNAG